MFSLPRLIFYAFGGALLIAASASADPAYKAEDVVKFFTASGESGLTRGICVGTAQECENNNPKPASSAFDMLVTFDVDSDALTSAAKSNLLQFAKALKDPRLTVARFAVEGHTDASGPEDYNMDLSIRRARAVAAFLIGQGVAPDRFEAKGFGETSPRVANPLDSVNRRVETRIILQ